MSDHHTHRGTQEKSGCCGDKHKPQNRSAPKEERPNTAQTKATPAKPGCCD